jgi:hypothetical protein
MGESLKGYFSKKLNKPCITWQAEIILINGKNSYWRMMVSIIIYPFLLEKKPALLAVSCVFL